MKRFILITSWHHGSASLTITVSPLTMTFEVLQKEAVGIIALNEMVCGSASLTMTMFVERVEKRFSKKNC